MWITDSLWFEIAIVSIIFALGNILFGSTCSHHYRSNADGAGDVVRNRVMIMQTITYTAKEYNPSAERFHRSFRLKK
jgi:hypothetical protein